MPSCQVHRPPYTPFIAAYCIHAVQPGASAPYFLLVASCTSVSVVCRLKAAAEAAQACDAVKYSDKPSAKQSQDLIANLVHAR